MALFQKKSDDEKAETKKPESLVESIVRQAGQSAAETESSEQDPHVLATLAHAILTLVILASLGIWVYFYAVLDSGNYIFDKFGKQNIATQHEQKQTLSEQLVTDLGDTQEFITLLEIENLATRTLSLDLEDPALDGQVNIVEKLENRISRDTNASAEAVYRVLNEDGAVVEISESELRARQDKRAVGMEYTKAVLREIRDQAANIGEKNNLKAVKKTLQGKNQDDSLASLLVSLEAINPTEINFPSATDKANYAVARAAAKDILVIIKDANLKNLIADLKKQAATIDVSDADEATQAAVTQLQTAIDKLSAKRPTSFESASRDLKNFDTKVISDTAVQKKAQQIIDDLGSASAIAHNIGSINIINDLGAKRIVWSNAIKNVRAISRLGADLLPDDGATYDDARRDIDTSGRFIVFTGYTGKSKDDKLSLKGRVIGEGIYNEKNFTLLADLIDAFEASNFFYDVTGFSFSKNKNPDGQYFAPLNLDLLLQNPSSVHTGDIKVIEAAAEIITAPEAPVITEPVIEPAVETTTETVPVESAVVETPAAEQPVDNTSLPIDPFAQVEAAPQN